jgi:drug/metabolite transporter (DMT)-like permease
MSSLAPPPAARTEGARVTSARLVLAVAVVCVSTGAIFVRLADCPALAVAAWRMTFATALISVALPRSYRELGALRRRDLVLGGGAGLCLGLHFATWISSLDHTTVASSVVLVNTTPLWVAMLSPLVTGERTTRRAAAGIALSVLGAAIIAGGDVRLGGRALLGDGLALVGGLTAAMYLLLGRNLRSRLSLPTYCALTYGHATVALWLLVAVANVPASGLSVRTWGVLAAMAVVAQLGGHTLYNWSLGHLSTAAVSVALLGEPVISPLLAWWIFGEAPRGATVSGASLVLLGIYLGSQMVSRHPAAETGRV